MHAVQIGDEVGELREVKYGVSQGTVLGIWFFIIYQNYLFDLPSVGDMMNFADDTAICFDFVQIIEFLNYKLLTINVDKP